MRLPNCTKVSSLYGVYTFLLKVDSWQRTKSGMSDPVQSDEKPTVGDLALFDAITWTLFSIASVTTVLRLLTRRFFLHATGADDLLVVAATVCLVEMRLFILYIWRMSEIAYLTFTNT